MVVDTSIVIFTLVEITVMNILLHYSFIGSHYTSTTCLVGTVKGVSISNVLGMNVTATLDHWQLLSVKKLIRVRSETSTNWFLIKIFIVTPIGQIWQFFLCLSELVIILFLIGVNTLELFCALDLNLRAMSSHVI